MVAKQLEGQAREVPLFVGNTKFYGGGPAYLGPSYAPYMPSPRLAMVMPSCEVAM